MIELAFFLSTLNNRVSLESYDKIDVGMTRRTVERMLGGPSRGKRTRNDAFNFYYTTISDDIMTNGETWMSPMATIWVCFDCHDLVTAKTIRYIVPSKLPEPTAATSRVAGP
jgi:outer membrane protein assembly factor BamE (lipoprotein component of BamABCDE complex)